MEFRISSHKKKRTLYFWLVLDFFFRMVFLVISFHVVADFDGRFEADQRKGLKEVVLADLRHVLKYRNL